MSAPAPSTRFRAVALLDRDGTINEEVEFLADPGDFRLLPDAARAIRILNGENIAAVVTTNQSGIPRGLLTEETLAAIHERMTAELAAHGARLDGVYHAPSLPDSNDPRRKPAIGMYHDAVRDLGLEGLPVYAIGDRSLDVEFGLACGGKAIRVLTGHKLKADMEMHLEHLHAARKAHRLFTEESLFHAVHRLLADLVLDEAPEDRYLRGKFGHLHKVADEIAVERRRGNRVVLTNGCFDLLHGGHVSYLETAKSMGDRLVLAVNSNASIRRLKGEGRPILSETDRLRLLAALKPVDYLTLFHEDAADYVLETLRPDIHAKGTDYTSDNVPELQTARRLGIETRIAGQPKENSSRDIIEVVLERTRAGLL